VFTVTRAIAEKTAASNADQRRRVRSRLGPGCDEDDPTKTMARLGNTAGAIGVQTKR